MTDPRPDDAALLNEPSQGCASVLRRAFEFLDGALPSDAAGVVREHLAACGPCRARVAGDAAFLRLLARPALVERCPDALRRRIAASLAVKSASPSRDV